MENFQLFYQIKEVHGMIAGVTFLCVILSDLYGATWILGFQKYLKQSILHWSHRIVMLGLLALILSGGTMVSLNSEEFLTNMAFWAKMFFVLVLFFNAFRIQKELDIPVTKTFSDLDSKTKKHMFIVGATSIVSWVSALFLAGML
jgi:hypothetical protein